MGEVVGLMGYFLGTVWLEARLGLSQDSLARKDKENGKLKIDIYLINILNILIAVAKQGYNFHSF